MKKVISLRFGPFFAQKLPFSPRGGVTCPEKGLVIKQGHKRGNIINFGAEGAEEGGGLEKNVDFKNMLSPDEVNDQSLCVK